MKFLGSIAAVAALCASAAAAQPTPPSPSPTARTMYAFVAMNGYNTWREPSEPPIMRRAEPVGEAADWLAEDDPVVALIVQGELKNSAVSLILTIDANGRAIDCRPTRQRGDPRLFEGLCERVMPRVRMVPALSEDGKRVPDSYEAYVAPAVGYEKPKRLVREQLLPPVVAGPPADWPPTSAFGGIGITKLDLLQRPLAADPSAEKTWAGVMVLPRRTPPYCKVQGSSGDAKFNDRVCKAALKANYDFRDGPAWRDRAYILFVEEKGKVRAALPVSERATDARVTPEGAAAIRAALADLSAEARDRLRLSVAVDPSGAVTRCRIYGSSGADDTDVRACAAARAARFSPALDIFGRPIADTVHGWRAAAPPKP